VSAPSDHPIGCGRPPKARQWKKGQRGNPTERRPNAPESTLALIDRLLVAPVPITLNGETKKVPAIEAIVLQLMQKEMAGNPQAARTLLKYREFANQNADKRLEVIFVESDYTRALSGQSEEP
jgi:hypothetical protein